MCLISQLYENRINHKYMFTELFKSNITSCVVQVMYCYSTFINHVRKSYTIV